MVLIGTLTLAGLALAAKGDAVADRVLGQPDFSSGSSNNGALPAAAVLSAPRHAAVDKKGRLYVVDRQNDRILSWPSATSFTNGQAADLVLGQASFNTPGGCNQGLGAPTAATLCEPTGVAADTKGTLWVVDQLNHRVLRYSAPLSNGQAADLVLGQANFTTSSAGTSSTKLNNPNSAAVDKNGNVFVSEESNNRIVRFSPPFSNGQAANLVLGQADFTSFACNRGLAGPNATTLCDPEGLAFDKAGNLYVSEDDNDRVLRFNPPFSTGQAASLVIGQPNFGGDQCNQGGAPTASSLCVPRGAAVDKKGNLWVGDRSNNRALRFSAPLTSGMAASLVLGQPNFTSNQCNQGGARGAGTLCIVDGLAVDKKRNVYVVDTNNNRVLGYDRP